MNRGYIILGLCLVHNLAVGAGQTQSPWVALKITELAAAPVSNPPAAIIQKTWGDAIYYYIPPKCCDQFSALFDHTGQFVCSPDGGFAGVGDGQCPTFVQKLGAGTVLWEDPR